MEKTNLYSGLADHVRATFVPFAVETTGGIGVQAFAFIKQMITIASRTRNVWSPKELVNEIYRSITCAVIKGNYTIFSSNKNRSDQRGVI